MLRGDPQAGDTFAVRSPIGVVIEAARPTLRWDALAGATSYKVTIYDPNFNVVASTPPLTTTSWTVSQPLVRGKIYSWQVTALKADQEIKSPKPPAPEARFKVLDAAKAGEIEQARRALANSHLALGVLYARAGLLNDAEREFNALLRANPGSEVARKLLSDVRKKR